MAAQMEQNCRAGGYPLTSSHGPAWVLGPLGAGVALAQLAQGLLAPVRGEVIGFVSGAGVGVVVQRQKRREIVLSVGQFFPAGIAFHISNH